MSHYNKAIIALAVGILSWVGVVLASDASEITNTEWSQLIASLVTAIGVYAVKNGAAAPPAP